MAMGWYAAYQSDDRQFIFYNFASALVAALHFGMLGSMVGVGLMLISGLRFGISLYSKHASWGTLFAIVTLIQGVYLFEGWYDGFGIASSMMACWILFAFEGRQLRIAAFICILLSLVHSVGIDSWSSILYCTGTMISLAWGLLRSTPKSETVAA
ncbi:hypothetical protein GCM10007895_11880 [Paraferrimonas sedimenticola]|uniref:Inner membrane protein n=2 Tax=Paraferrimonas sedimenticola TaxID=375674 RepID=A0AA37RW87_9GAMM|nr:hypothetical protein GCM10007895_11880 [Paraferrimonas sedimenticola]